MPSQKNVLLKTNFIITSITEGLCQNIKMKNTYFFWQFNKHCKNNNVIYLYDARNKKTK